MEILLLFLVFVVVSGFTFAGYLYLSQRRQHIEQRLRSSEEEDSAPAPLLGDLTPTLAAQIPISAEDQGELQKELRTAGNYRPTALLEYRALRTVLVIVPLLAAGVLALFTSTVGPAAILWLAALIVAGLGYSLPRIFLYYRGRARQHAIERGLPTALDMLNLCLSAGLNILHSLERVAREIPVAFPVLAYELEIVRRQAELRTLEFALGQFADRVDMPSVRNIAVILSQSEGLGADAARVLREYADDLRIHMRQRADELANKAPFKLLFPAYLLVFGAAILIFSPVALEFAAFRRANILGNTMQESREGLRQLPSQQRPPSP
jgi:tight adherence protein C